MGKAPVLRGKSLERQAFSKRSGGHSRPSRPADEAHLERAAVHYLARFAATVEHFKEVMRRKIARCGLPDGVTEAEAEAWIERLTARCEALGLLNDAGFAEARAASLFRRGRPTRVVRRALVAKGVPPALAADAVAAVSARSEDADLDAARAFARRKRLGPFGPGEEDPGRRGRELAAFARAGFSFEVARRVLAEDKE
jgi:regulatory protein